MIRFKPKSKYKSIKTKTYDGAKHDSKKEARRWLELQMLEKVGEIRDLQRQVPFELVPAMYEGEGKNRRCVERSVKYVADFVYTTKDGRRVVEDTKSPPTRKNKDYIIKRKLMLWLRGIKVEER